MSASKEAGKDAGRAAGRDDAAGDLLIQEVEEELRHEQYLRLWKRHGTAIVGAAALVVLLVAGYQGWRGWQSRLRQDEAVRYNAAELLLSQGKSGEAAAALEGLIADSHTGFAVLARLRRAELLSQTGDATGALAVYQTLAAQSSAPTLYRDLAVLKASLLALDSGDPAPWESQLAGLTAAANPWHLQATETLAALALKKGDAGRAVDLYKQLADDLGAPQGIRARAAEMLAVLGPQPAAKAKG